MRSGARLAIAFAVAITVAACDSATQPDAATTDTAQAPVTISDQSTATAVEPVPLVLSTEGRTLGGWQVSPDGKRAAYTVGGREEKGLFIVGVDAEPRMVIPGDLSGSFEFLDDDRILLRETRGEGTRLRITDLDGTVTLVAEIQGEVTVVGATESGLIYAIAKPRQTEILLWEGASGITTTLAKLDHRRSGLDDVAVIGDHIAFTIREGSWSSAYVVSTSGNELAEIPPSVDQSSHRLLGETPDGRLVMTESARDLGLLYTVDLSSPEEKTIFSRRAINETTFLEGTEVRFTTFEQQAKILDLTTGEISDHDGSRSWQPPGPVAGMKDENLRFRGELTNGNWLISGFAVDGPQYENTWRNADTGEVDTSTAATQSLFEYNPATETLWQVSGEPTIINQTTQRGTGEVHSWVLAARALDGFVVYTTGFSGAAWDVEYNLYMSGYPSGS